MTTPMAATSTTPRRLGRSAGAVLLGFVVVVVLSLGTDQVFHLLKVYPPWGEPMRDPALNLLALVYRIGYDTFGSYLTARFAPHSPMRHALIGGVIGLAVCAVGAIATIPMDLRPAWYPIALAASALPTAWLGGAVYQRQQARMMTNAATV